MLLKVLYSTCSINSYGDSTLTRKLQVTGNGSYILTIPSQLVSALGLEKGIEIEVTLEGKKIMLAPAPKVTRQDAEGTGAPTPTTI